jgi:hypothetical protein
MRRSVPPASLPLSGPALLAAALVGALGTGCKDVEGRWLGDCDFDHPTYSYLALVDLQIDDGAGSNVEGSVTFDLSDGGTFTGKQSGLRSDTYLELEGVLTNEADFGPYKVTFAGEIDEDFETIEGECSFAVPDGEGRLIGELELAR